MHERTIYGILDVFGDFGGVAEVVTGVAAYLLSSISAHNFSLKIIAKLFFAKTKDPYLFSQKKSLKAKKKEKQ